MDNGTEFVRTEFVELPDRRGIHREYIPVGVPEQNVVVERHIAVTLEFAMASCLEAPRLFGDSRLPSTGPLLASACNYACDVINPTARVRDKPEIRSPYRTFHGRAPFARKLPCMKPGFHHVKRTLMPSPNRKLASTSTEAAITHTTA